MKLYVNNSTSSDIARLQDEVNTGRVGELPVIVGSLSSFVPELDKVMMEDTSTTSAKDETGSHSEVTSDATKALLYELFNAGWCTQFSSFTFLGQLQRCCLFVQPFVLTGKESSKTRSIM